jgi:sarcosine oxidase
MNPRHPSYQIHLRPLQAGYIGCAQSGRQGETRHDGAGYFEPSAGFLRPEECIRAHLRMAQPHGAVIHRDQAVSGYDVSNGLVVVTTSRERYSADKLIVAAGAWLPDLVDDRIAKCFTIYRQTMCWFDVLDSATLFDPDHFPGGVKVSTEQYAISTTADTAERTVSRERALRCTRN